MPRQRTKPTPQEAFNQFIRDMERSGVTANLSGTFGGRGDERLRGEFRYEGKPICEIAYRRKNNSSGFNYDQPMLKFDSIPGKGKWCRQTGRYAARDMTVKPQSPQAREYATSKIADAKKEVSEQERQREGYRLLQLYYNALAPVNPSNSSPSYFTTVDGEGRSTQHHITVDWSNGEPMISHKRTVTVTEKIDPNAPTFIAKVRTLGLM